MDFSIFSSSLQTLLHTDVLIALFGGVAGGMVIGALPGFSAAMGVALLLPLTFGMAPIPSMVMLTALYTSAIYGGSITAILIHTPGTPASAATADDGFELTKQGKGLQALGVSTTCSTMGGFLSGVALLFIAPMLAKICLWFGPAEYFMVALFGLTIIASLCNGGVMKGMACAAFGLSLSCIGLDSQTGYPRFMYGSTMLADGLQTIPLLIGLFSISQVMIMSEEAQNANASLVDKAVSNLKGKMLLPLREWIGLIIPTIRSSIIGIIVGILPGAGGDIASYLAVNMGKNSSKHPELYGKGSFEAVACAETANNAVSGGAMIPLLTLSIPGSATAAILLGGFTMHGLIPGSSLFTEQAGQVYPIIIGFTLSNLVMGVLGLLAARYVAKVTVVPISVLAPIIVVLATLGSYAMKLSMLDVWIMAIFGLIGYLMRKHDLITAPIVLAIILGPLAERNLLRSLIVKRSATFFDYYMSRPIVLVLVALSVISIAIPLIRELRGKNKKAAVAATDILEQE